MDGLKHQTKHIFLITYSKDTTSESGLITEVSTFAIKGLYIKRVRPVDEYSNSLYIYISHHQLMNSLQPVQIFMSVDDTLYY